MKKLYILFQFTVYILLCITINAQDVLDEFSRDYNKPVITLLDPEPKEDLIIEIPMHRTEITLKGKIN